MSIKSLSIIKIEKTKDGSIHIYPSTLIDIQFEYVYRTATGIRWDNNSHYFYEYESSKSSTADFVINTIFSVKGEYDTILLINENTEIINISSDEINNIITKYFINFIYGIDNYKYVYVNNDGSVREVNLSERIYLQTKYHGADGNRQYIKRNYKDKASENKIQGYCLRSNIPKKVFIQKVTQHNYCIDIADELHRVKNMGYEIDYNGIEFLKLVTTA